MSTQSIQADIRVHYLGHASFLLRFGDDLSVLTDYGAYNAWAEWGWDSPIYNIGVFIPDVATYSHTHHEDHCLESRRPKGVGTVLRGESSELNGVKIQPLHTSEKKLGEEDNTSYLFHYKGLKVLHLGDCQANIMAIEKEDNREHIRRLFGQGCDLLLMPIESQEQFIPQAEIFLRELSPKRMIPMHYWSEAYRRDFFAHLAKQNLNGKRLYETEEAKSAEYAFSIADAVDPVHVISLDPAAFHE